MGRGQPPALKCFLIVVVVERCGIYLGTLLTIQICLFVLLVTECQISYYSNKFLFNPVQISQMLNQDKLIEIKKSTIHCFSLKLKVCAVATCITHPGRHCDWLPSLSLPLPIPVPLSGLRWRTRSSWSTTCWTRSTRWSSVEAWPSPFSRSSTTWR